MGEAVWFEDLSVGQSWTSAPRRLERDQIIAFATEFDPQAQHLSEDAARASLFGELVASGWHTAAFTMRLMLDTGVLATDGRMLGAGIEEISWPTPVRPGDALRAQCEVLALRPLRSRPELGLLTLRTTALNERDEPVLVMTSRIMLRRRPAA
jgi:acyl dehydratase